MAHVIVLGLEGMIRCARRRWQYRRWNSSVSARDVGANRFGVTLALGAGIGAVASYYYAKANIAQLDVYSATPLKRSAPRKYGGAKDLENAIGELTVLLGEDGVDVDEEELKRHSSSLWSSYFPKPHEKAEPNIICYPGSTEHVSAIAKIATKYKIPMTAFAGGTSLEGHFHALSGGISVDFAKMDQILVVHDQDLDCVVQPAVGWEELQQALKPHGLLFGPDPGPGAKIGGMVGTGCSGTNAARYGTMRENVLSLTVVLADGTIIKTRQRPRKSSAGYDLTKLFIGSEGTLGLVTEATLKLHPTPQEQSVAVCTFPSVRDAANATQQIIRSGIEMGAIELLDENQMHAINAAKATERSWKEMPTLFLKFGGTKQGVSEQIKLTEKITNANNGQKFEFAKSEHEKEQLWSARKEALWSLMALKGKEGEVWTTDVTVPLSRLPDIIQETKDDLQTSGLFCGMVAHAADGNFHAILLYDKATAGEREKAEELVHNMVQRALRMEGTCTGEHGVGLVKKEYLLQELGQSTVETMRRLKLALDPNELLNPGLCAVPDFADFFRPCITCNLNI